MRTLLCSIEEVIFINLVFNVLPRTSCASPRSRINFFVLVISRCLFTHLETVDNYNART